MSKKRYLTHYYTDNVVVREEWNEMLDGKWRHGNNTNIIIKHNFPFYEN